MWKGHNNSHVLAKDADKQAYIDALAATMTDKIRSSVDWYSYCLMGNHPHETGSVSKNPLTKIDESIHQLGNWMRNAHSRFGTQFNKRHNRRGTVACERPRTDELDDDVSVLKCMFYADANPVRAGLVSHPSKWQYSSYNLYACGEKVAGWRALTPPPAYMALGKTDKERRRKYRRLCNAYLRREGLLLDVPKDHENPYAYEEELGNALSDIAVNGRQLVKSLRDT